jgi:hypothetical protein
MKSVLLIVFSIVLFSARAQQKSGTQSLQNYQYRTNGFKLLSVNGGLSNSFNIGNYPNQNNTLNIAPVINYYGIKSTVGKQAETYANVQSLFYFNKSKAASNNQKQSLGRLAGNFTTTTKKFKKTSFIETGFYITPAMDLGTITADTLTQKNNDYNAAMGFTIGVGKGRIENVTDAQMAFFILTDLQKQKLLAKDFDSANLTDLAKLITAVNNTLLFDFRRKRIFELQQIDSFLQKSNLIDKYSIGYFTTLADNWYYAFNPNRRHGKQKYIRWQPGVAYSNQSQNQTKGSVFTSQKSKSTSVIGTLAFGMDNYNAKSMKLQFNKGISLATGYQYTNAVNDAGNTTITTGSGSLFSRLTGYLEWGYFPNTRTNVFASVFNQLLYAYDGNGASNLTGIAFNANYFVSYNTRIIIRDNLNFIAPVKNSFGNNQLSHNISVGVEHFFR